MCLYTRQTSKWEISKVRNGDTKIPVEENIKISEEMKDKKIDINKDVNDNNDKREKKRATIKLATLETQKIEPGEKCNDNDNKPKFRNIDLNDNKKLKQNEVKLQFANSFIAEFTQNSVSKSGKASSTRKKTESVIRDNTLEEIPRDMPKYNSIQ